MATLTPSLTLKMDYSSTGGTTGNLVVSVDDSLTTTSPHINLARKSVATGAASELIPTNSSTMYIYIKAVSGENATDFLQVKIGSYAVMRLKVGEFLFVPVYNGYAINTESYGGAIVTEYGYWTQG
jgi:hypothetical protein